MAGLHLSTSNLPVAPLIKRFMAMFYDFIIIVALSMGYSAIATGFMALVLHIPAEDYLPMQKGIGFRLGWLLTIVSFFWFFWYRVGQTVGMKTWRLKIVSDYSENLQHWQVLVRLALTPLAIGFFGLGYFWSFIDKDKLALHDKITNTRVVVTPKIEKKPKTKK